MTSFSFRDVSRLRRLRNPLNHLSSPSRVFHPRSDIRLRDYSHQLPVVVYDRNSSYLMLFHQANRLVGIVIDPTGDDGPGHNLTDSRGVGIAILSDKLQNYVAIRNHSFQPPVLQVV